MSKITTQQIEDLKKLRNDCKEIIKSLTEDKKLSLIDILNSLKEHGNLFAQNTDTNIRQSYYYIVDDKGSVFENENENILKSKNETFYKNKKSSLDELHNSLLKIELLLINSEPLFFATMFYTEQGFRHGILKLDLKGGGIEKAEIKVLSKEKPDLSSYSFISQSKKDIIQNGQFLSMILKIPEGLFSHMLFINARLGSNSFTDVKFCTCTYSTFSKINDNNGPSAGVATFLKIDDNTFTEEVFNNILKESDLFSYIPNISGSSNTSRPFIEYYLREKRVLAEPENIKTLENLREYDKWNKSIKNKAGVYIGYTIRSWQSNYKTFEQFIIKIEASGKATLTALDDNDEFRFGFIDSAEHNYFSIRFSDKEFTEDGSFRFKMTFVSDPTSLPNERNIGYVGVMSGLEKTMSPSAGKVALIRVSIDTNIDVTKYPFLKKRNSSTSMGLSQVVSSFFDSFRTGILEQFLTTESDKQAFERIYPKNWLTGFFAPYNIYDFNETNVIYRNWFGHNIGIGDLGISQPIHLLLFSASKEFYRRELNNEKLDVYKYPLRVQSDRTVLAFTLSNDTNGLSGESHLIDDHFIFTCFDNKNDDKRFYLQGVIKNWRSLVKAALGDTKNKIYCEGVIIVRSRDSEFLKAARIIAIPDKEKYTDVNNWRDAYKKPIVDDDDTSKQHTKISYNLRNSTETELLDSHFKGLSNYMKGHMNRLIVSEPLEQVNQYELKRRFKENITVYFYSACFAAQRNETELAKKYLWQAWSHGFPSDGQSNQEHMKLIKETVFDEKGVFNNVFFKSLFEKIWVNEYIKWKNIYSK